MPMRESIRLEKFWRRVDKSSGCWIWTGPKGPEPGHNYGKLMWHNKYMRAHRVAYELMVGPIPEGLCVLHSCDNPLCVNPNHLFLGTQLDNIRDRDAKGRAPSVESCSHPKLTWAEVDDIRARYAKGSITQRELASEHHVHISTISLIVRYLRWNRPRPESLVKFDQT